jgi:hypothetical protein
MKERRGKTQMLISFLRFALPLVALASQSFAATTTNETDGAWLASFYDGLQVEQHWLAGHKIHWMSGEAISNKKGATHCSAFVAAACMKLGIYLLRPPDHPQDLLANAQMGWLREHGGAHGWRPVATPAEAQALANSGIIVVAVYENPDPKKPGHIALVRPCVKSAVDLDTNGPQVIQAGGHNHNSCSLREGFRQHNKAWHNSHDFQVRFYSNRNITRPAQP